MKILIFLLLLFCNIQIQAEQPLIFPIVDVHDGDTIKTTIPLPIPLNNVSIRLLNVDTPEMPAKSYATTGKLGRAKCVKEAELALKAKKLVNDLAKIHKVMIVTNYKYGKYGGRILGNVNIGGNDLALLLIQNNLAVPYLGGKKTKNWCL